MAQKVRVLLVDDVDGGEADESISFALDGVEYGIDLSTENADVLRKALEPFVSAGRRIGRSKGAPSRPHRTPRHTTSHTPPPPARSSSSTSSDGAAASTNGPRLPANQETIRSWARSHGYQVADRGRISREVQAAFEKANA